MNYKNRLRLDFSLNTQEERRKFVDNYVGSQEFVDVPLRDEELEMIANYLLWGKDEDGLNEVQKKNVQIASRKSTWTSDNVDSLDGLLENPAFNENLIRPYNSTPTKSKKETFNRKAALDICPDSLRPTLETLFREIDETDLIINLYELEVGKRTEIRPALLSLFSETELDALRKRAADLNQFSYLKMRHLLVEMRRQQYTIRDSFVNTIQLHNPNPVIHQEPPHIVFDADIPVFPFGIMRPHHNVVYLDSSKLCPAALDVDTLSEISKLVWAKHDEFQQLDLERDLYFDFRNEEHVYQLLVLREDLELDHNRELIELTTLDLLKTLDYYVGRATLTDTQREILDLKLRHERNQDIASKVNKKYGKTYTTNYISTIFKQRIVPQIAAAAKLHQKIVENLFFEEEFKVCTSCGLTLLRCEENFVRKTRSKDGFSNRCKRCDKLDRQKKKEVRYDD